MSFFPFKSLQFKDASLLQEAAYECQTSSSMRVGWQTLKAERYLTSQNKLHSLVKH